MAFEHAGLTVQKERSGPLGLLSPKMILRDERLGKTTRFFWTVLTNQAIREHIWQMHRVFHQYRQELAYVTFCAID